MTASVTVPVRTVSETNARTHWVRTAARRKAQRQATTLSLRCHARLPSLPVTVTLTRLAPRRLDDDNLRGALKAVRDGVADVYRVDDSDARIRWKYHQLAGGVRQYAVVIDIEGDLTWDEV